MVRGLELFPTDFQYSELCAGCSYFLFSSASSPASLQLSQFRLYVKESKFAASMCSHLFK